MHVRATWLIFGVITLASAVCPSQGDSRIKQGASVKSAALKLDLKTQPKVTIIGRDLLMRRGVVTSVGDAELVVQPPKKAPEVGIVYTEILQITGPGLNISFVPDPQASAHGDWSDVRRIGLYGPIGVVLVNGKEMFGRFGGAGDENLALLGAGKGSVLKIPRESIVRVFGVTDGKGGVKEYTRRGLKGGSQVGAPEALVVMPVAAGVGSLIGLSKQKKRRVILVFAR